ncbi:alpha/beta fold hydrolase [Pseudonocardia xinjiangensis]|uniref:alpha/beta fold hydrolase n=1 Tax=Pseudonocardia xinjiangensis TaxID=75289 RepID=UPI003D93729A
MVQPLSYYMHGSGPGIVLVPGIGTTGADSWGPVPRDLADSHTVVVPNLPGSGESPLPDGPLDLDTVADQVVATAQDAGLERFTLAAVLLGPGIALRVTTRHPARVSRLALLAGFARPRPSLRLWFEIWAALSGDDEAVSKLMVLLSLSDGSLAASSDEQIDLLVEQITRGRQPGAAAQLDLATRLDVRADLAKIGVPTLVMTGTGDDFVAPAHSHEIADGVPGARLVEIAGGHGFWMENPDTVAVLREFLGD